jgi:S-adenosylmethionine/arginine decarboxylase-like enzyme
MKAQIFNYSDWVKETDPEKLHLKYKNMLLKAGFQVIQDLDYHFEPYGYSALFLLAESHFAIHTFPEENKTYIELSSCVEDKYNRFVSAHKSVERD